MSTTNFTQNVADDKSLKPKCPHGHELVFWENPTFNWGCDMGAYKNSEVLIPGRINWDKRLWGLAAEEEYNCVRGCTSLYQLRNTPCYRCQQDDFYLCDKCYERAVEQKYYGKAINASLEETAKVEWMQSKLMVVGEGAAGKTSTVRTLLGLPFKKNWDSTVGASLTQATSGNDGELWGEVGEEEKIDHVIQVAAQHIQKMPETTFQHQTKGAKGKMNGLALKNMLKAKKRRLLEQRRRIKEMKQMYAQMTDEEKQEFDAVKAAAKLKKKEKPEREKGDGLKIDSAEVMGKMNIESIENANNRKDKISFTIWDYGGQTVFYSLHHLFLTKYGIYLVVFNLHSFVTAKKQTEEFLVFWLNSIQLHAGNAPILLVGTHIDRVKSLKNQTEEVSKEFEAKYGNFNLVKNNRLSFFPLDNRKSKGIGQIRVQIELASREQDFLYNKVSLHWLRCLDLLLDDPGKSWVSMANVVEYGQRAQITSELEIENMLEYFNEVGVVLYFNSTVALRQLVIVNPQWLIDKLGNVIRDDSIHHFNLAQIEELQLGNDLKELTQNALASRDLLEFLWGNQVTPFLIDLMRRVMLLSDWMFGGDSDGQFLIPSLLKKTNDFTKKGTKLRYDFKESFLPRGCFERLVCLCVDYAVAVKATRAPEIYANAAVIYLEEGNTMALELNNDSIDIQVEPKDMAVRYRKIIQSMFYKLNVDSMSGGLKWRTFFQEGDSLLTEEDVGRQGLPTWFEPERKEDEENTHGLDLDAFMDQL